MLLNFIFALFILKTNIGLLVFRTLADMVTDFLGFTDKGSSFIFGDDTETYKKPFAFTVGPDVAIEAGSFFLTRCNLEDLA